MSAAKPLKNIFARDAKHSQEFNFNGVAVKLIEVNRLQHPFGPDTFTIAYKIVDSRVTPFFESPVAHLFLQSDSNVIAEMKKVVDLYEQTRESIFKVKIPEEANEQ